jgi:hypothetical protein
VTGANSTVSYNLTGSIEVAPVYAPAQLDTPPLIVKIQNNGISDAANVVLEHSFSPTVRVITILPLSSENLGSIGPGKHLFFFFFFIFYPFFKGETASLSYYLNIPATPNTSYDGAWTLSSSGYFSGNISVYVTPNINGNISGLTPIKEFSFTSIVDFVCHHHTDCQSCLKGKFYFFHFFLFLFFKNKNKM